MRLKTLAMTALAVTLATATVAQDAVKTRTDEMEKVGAALKRLNLRTRSLQVSPDQAREAVATIRRVALNTPKLFEEQDLSPPSEAKPEIWANWNDFVARSAQLAAYTEKLDDLVNDQAKLASAIKEMGEICSACHRRYRK